MSAEQISEKPSAKVAFIPLLAALVALAGLADSIYLTVHHYSGEAVPCSIVKGCEVVLNSSYAQIAGIPLALFGAAAYFAAFALSLLAAFGSRAMWTLFGVQVMLMAAFTTWLLYLQGYVIGDFCQFCLLSAAITFTMLILFFASKFFRAR